VATAILSQGGRAFRELLDLLEGADETFLAGFRVIADEVGIAEGYRHLTHLLGYALELYFEGDPARPTFTPLASPTRKILGDNVDSLYHFALLDGRQRAVAKVREAASTASGVEKRALAVQRNETGSDNFLIKAEKLSDPVSARHHLPQTLLLDA
jgi:hypothetical protein